MKCNKCNLKNIEKIVFYDFVVQRCKDCKHIRLFFNDFELLKNQILYLKNIGNIRQHDNICLCSKLNQKHIDDFFQFFTFTKSIDEKVINECDVCGDKLTKKIIKKYNFIFYECEYCRSIYFLKNDFDKLIDKIIKDIYRKNYFFKIYFNLCNYIKIRKMKLKEIFHRKVKNNVKK